MKPARTAQSQQNPSALSRQLLQADTTWPCPPTQLFPKIQGAFEKLITFAETDRSPKDYRELIEQLKALRNETEKLVAAAKAVHTATKEK